MLRRLLVIVASACTTPPAPSPIAPPAQVPVVPAAAAFVATPVSYVAPIEQPVRRYCPPIPAPAPLPAPGSVGKTKRYDFTPIAIDARFGSTARTQPRASYARDPESIRAAIQRAGPRLGECLRAARSAGMRTRDFLDVFLELEIDPFGAITNLTLDAPKQLEACVQATLLGVRVRRQAARITRATIRLDFSSISMAPALKVMPAAPPPTPARGHCFVGSDPLPVDELTLAPVEIDFDPPPRIRRPASARSSCRDLDVDKLQIRRGVLAIHGDLRTCYLDALVRQPALEGTATAELSVGTTGGFEQVTVTGAGDGVLHACLADALGATGASTEPSGPILVNIPFALSRSSTGYDRETAAQGFAERAGAAATADASCRARTALVGAYLGTDPAGAQPVGVTIDPRVMPALESLSELVAANPGPVLAGCLDDLSSLLVHLGRHPMRDDEPARLQAARGRGLAEAIERSQRIVELFPHVERSLLLFIADGLAMLDQHDAARDAYVRFLSIASADRDAMERAADSFAVVTRNRDDRVLWDDCPR